MIETELLAQGRDLAPKVIDLLDFGLIALGENHEILFLNRKALETLDTKPEALLGKPVGDLLLSRTPGFSLWPDHSPEPMEDPREVMVEFEGRELLLHWRWIAAPPEDNAVAALVAFEDINDRVSEIEFQRRVDRFASVGELAAVIAHEIRNPLTGIRTTIQYVAGKLEGQDVLRQDLKDSISELDRIEQFTTELLQFARPKSIQPEAQDVTPILERVLDNLDQQLKAANITVKRELDSNLPIIQLDADAIQHVFWNLILNSIEAMPEGGQFRVSSSSRHYRSKRAVEVAFHDTGCGIPEDVLDKVFDPFFTTRPNGTGLGLSISLQIVKQHSGRINMRNRSGGGATFRLSFPVPPEEVDDS